MWWKLHENKDLTEKDGSWRGGISFSADLSLDDPSGPDAPRDRSREEWRGGTLGSPDLLPSSLGPSLRRLEFWTAPFLLNVVGLGSLKFRECGPVFYTLTRPDPMFAGEGAFHEESLFTFHGVCTQVGVLGQLRSGDVERWSTDTHGYCPNVRPR